MLSDTANPQSRPEGKAFRPGDPRGLGVLCHRARNAASGRSAADGGPQSSRSLSPVGGIPMHALTNRKATQLPRKRRSRRSSRLRANGTPSISRAEHVLDTLVREVFPALGARQATASQALEISRPIQARGAIEAAHRLRDRVAGTSDLAIATGADRA